MHWTRKASRTWRLQFLRLPRSVPAHSPVMLTLLGFAFAIFSAIAAAYLFEYLDPSFRTPAEVTDTLNIPVLAFVPKRAA